MSPKPIADLAASVHRRLLNQARAGGRPFNELLQHYAMGRFMARLARSPYALRFVLKGGLLMDAWSASRTRPTVDIDLLGMVKNDPSTVQSIIAEICVTEIEPDGLTFSIQNSRVERITEAAEYQGVRARFEAHLGTARVPMQVDVGFGDVVFPGAEAVSLPLLLDFSPTRFLAYSRESVIAEKLHAMVKLGSINSRMNDFFDLWFLSTNFEFNGETVARAIAATFEARRTAIPPESPAFSSEFRDSGEKQAQWTSFRRKSRLEQAPESLGEVVSQIAGFLPPVMRALADGSPFRVTWRPPGPWTGKR